MKIRLLSSLAAATLVAGMAAAAPPLPGDVLGTSLADVTAALGAEGYSVTKYERDDGRIEVYAHDAANRIELDLDPATGAVLSLEVHARAANGAQAGIDTAAALQALTDQGWEIIGYERERGEFEVYARRDGQRFELRLDLATGDVLGQERDD